MGSDQQPARLTSPLSNPKWRPTGSGAIPPAPPASGSWLRGTGSSISCPSWGRCHCALLDPPSGTSLAIPTDLRSLLVTSSIFICLFVVFFVF